MQYSVWWISKENSERANSAKSKNCIRLGNRCVTDRGLLNEVSPRATREWMETRGRGRNAYLAEHPCGTPWPRERRLFYKVRVSPRSWCPSWRTPISLHRSSSFARPATFVQLERVETDRDGRSTTRGNLWNSDTWPSSFRRNDYSASSRPNCSIS